MYLENSKELLALCALVFILMSGATTANAQSARYSEEQSLIAAESEIQTSDDWELTIDEVKTLNNLKRSNKGMISEDITPLEWLGIFADSEEQRKYYATRFAKYQLEVMNAIAKFEHAYSEALKGEISRKIDNTSSEKRLLLTTPYLCHDEKCRSNLAFALRHVEKGGSLEILIRESVSSTEIKSWIASNNIPQEKLKSQKILMNSSQKRYQQLPFGLYSLD